MGAIDAKDAARRGRDGGALNLFVFDPNYLGTLHSESSKKSSDAKFYTLSFGASHFVVD